MDGNDNVLKFLSYEGSFQAMARPADGMISLDIGVSETSNTPVGYSLQLMGTGCICAAYSWAPAVAESSPGSINNGQICNAPLPASPLPPVANMDIVCANHILISQVLYDEPGSTSNKEWVEFYNPTNAAVDLSSWLLNSYSFASGLYYYFWGSFHHWEVWLCNREWV